MRSPFRLLAITVALSGMVIAQASPTLSPGNLNPQQLITQELTLKMLNPPVPVQIASAQVVGTPGPLTYFYWIVARYQYGNAAAAVN